MKKPHLVRRAPAHFSLPDAKFSKAYAAAIANQKRTSFAYLTRQFFTNSHSCDAVGQSTCAGMLRGKNKISANEVDSLMWLS
jgi:hypothetical protein